MRAQLVVSPSSALASRRRLFEALEALYPVRFVGPDACSGDVSAASVHLDGSEPTSAGGRVLVYVGKTDRGETQLNLAADAQIDARLHGHVLMEKLDAAVPLDTAMCDSVLAADGRNAYWTVSGAGSRHDRVAADLVDLAPGERLRLRLAPGRFLALLPLLELMREVTSYTEWSRPVPTASLVIDDPNLHGASYGYLDFAELERTMTAVGGHASVAMVPLDSWYARRSVVEAFRRSSTLSLSVHGNDHLRQELSTQLVRQCAAIADTASRRMQRFSGRHNLDIDFVMVPPHGACSEPMLSALGRAGFQGVTYSGPVGDHGQPELVAMRPLDRHLAGGLPGLHRVPFLTSRDELVFRRYLDQPIILYGHHDDFRGGLGVLEEAVRRVDSLGTTQWSRMRDVLSSCWRLRREGSGALVEMEALSANVVLGGDVERLRFAAPQNVPVATRHLHVDGTETFLSEGQWVDVPSGERSLTVTSVPEPRVLATARTGVRPWPVARRVMCELRDRARPCAS